jgi:hypothetical protein
MNYGNSSTIGVDKVWMRIDADGIDVNSIDLRSERWSGTPQAKNIEGAYMPVRDSFRFDEIGEGHLCGKVDLLRRSAEVQFNPTHFFGDYALTSDVSGAFHRAFDLRSNASTRHVMRY